MQRLLNPHRLELYLTPDTLGWALVSGWRRTQVLEQGTYPFAAGNWQTGLAEALRQLPDAPLRQVMLSDALVRYAIAPWPAGIANRQELLLYAHNVFHEVHGLRPDTAELHLRSLDYQQPLFICGMPLDALAELRQICTAAGRKLPRVTPLFGRVFDLARKAMAGDGMLLLREHQQLTFCVLRQQRWQLINSLPLPTDNTRLLTQRIRQAAAAHGLPSEQPVHVVSLVAGFSAALTANGYDNIDLNPLLAHQPGLRACGVANPELQHACA